jgi:hypothetical protein
VAKQPDQDPALRGVPEGLTLTPHLGTTALSAFSQPLEDSLIMTDSQQPVPPAASPAAAVPSTEFPPPAEPSYAQTPPAPVYGQPADGTTGPRGNGLGVAALIVGIVALIFGVIPFVSYFGAFLAFVGLVLGVIALVLKGRKKGIAIAGTIVSGVALILSIVLSVVYTTAIVNSVNEAIESAAPSIEGPAEDEAVAEDEVADDAADTFVLGLGETMVWSDGVEMTVGAPAPFTPSETASAEPGQSAVLFDLTLTNNSEEPLEPLSFSQVTSGGVEASAIFDSANNIGLAPTATVLPGQSITWQEAFSVADPADITFQSSPGFLYDDAIWTAQ